MLDQRIAAKYNSYKKRLPTKLINPTQHDTQELLKQSAGLHDQLATLC
jgi:hypothetical protein